MAEKKAAVKPVCRKCCGDGVRARASAAGPRLPWRRRWHAQPEKPIGAATGTNLDEDGGARFTTISGRPIRRLYTQADLPEDWSEEKYLGYPGEAPYTRGIHATGYRGKVVDDAAVFRLRLAGGDQPALQISARAWWQRALGSLRFAYADGLRLRIIRSAKARWASAAWPSIRWRTWRFSSAASIWKRPPYR